MGFRLPSGRLDPSCVLARARTPGRASKGPCLGGIDGVACNDPARRRDTSREREYTAKSSQPQAPDRTPPRLALLLRQDGPDARGTSAPPRSNPRPRPGRRASDDDPGDPLRKARPAQGPGIEVMSKSVLPAGQPSASSICKLSNELAFRQARHLSPGPRQPPPGARTCLQTVVSPRGEQARRGFAAAIGTVSWELVWDAWEETEVPVTLP